MKSQSSSTSRKRISSEDALAGLALGAEVPQELWAAVAEVLAWAYSLGEGGNYPR